MNKSLIRQFLLGLLIGSMVSAETTYAQFGGIVFDPKNFSVNLSSKIEKAVQHAQQITTLVQQLTSLRGILTNAEKMITNNDDAAVFFANLGDSIRGAYELKNTVQRVIRSRLTMLESIERRAKGGVLDPEADMRDLDLYLIQSLGRKASDTIATRERLARYDNTLERLTREWKKANAERFQISAELSATNYQIEFRNRYPALRNCPSCIEALIRQRSDYKAQLDRLDNDIRTLESQIEERFNQYHMKWDKSFKFGGEIDVTTGAWRGFHQELQNIRGEMGRIGGFSLGN